MLYHQNVVGRNLASSNGIAPQFLLKGRRSQLANSIMQVLESLDFAQSKVINSVLRQTRVMVTYWWLAYCIIKARKPRY